MNLCTVKKYLSAEFWAGCRWMVHVIPSKIKCFVDFRDAAAYCAELSSVTKPIRIRILSSVLKGLNGIKSREILDDELAVVEEVIRRYPIQTLYKNRLAEELRLENFYPVLWQKVIHPLLETDKYFILRRDQKGACRIVTTSQSFSHAIEEFAICAKVDKPGDGQFLLVGQIQNRLLDIEGRDLEKGGAGIVFYQTETKLDSRTLKGRLEISQVQDPVDPIVQSVPIFTRYDQRKDELVFYDGRLKKARPGEDIEFLDLRFFDFE